MTDTTHALAVFVGSFIGGVFVILILVWGAIVVTHLAEVNRKLERIIGRLK